MYQSFLRRAPLWVAGLLVAACGGSTELDIKLVTRTCDMGGQLDPVFDATEIVFTAYGPGVDAQGTQVVVTRTSGAAKLESLPAVDGLNIVVEARREPGQIVVARGETGPLDLTVDRGNQPLPLTVFLRRLDTFTPTASADVQASCSTLTAGRAGHSATLLSDGRVLIAGGFRIDASRKRVWLDSTEIYDPKTGVFTEGPKMPVPQAFHSATALPGGGVLLAGGEGATASLSALRVVQLFDEETKQFHALAMREARRGHSAAVSASTGRVVIAGGYGMNGTPLKSVEVYDPASRTFTEGPTLPAGRAEASMLSLPGGALLMVGGMDADGPLLRSELINPLPNGQFTLSTSFSGLLRAGRVAPLAALVDDRHVFVGGGFSTRSASTPYPHATATAELLNAATGETNDAALLQKRGDGGMVALLDGTALVAGGAHMEGSALVVRQDAEVLSLSGQAAQPVKTHPTTAPLRDGRYQAAWTRLADGTVLVTGGLSVDRTSGYDVTLSSAEVYQPNYRTSRTGAYR